MSCASSIAAASPPDRRVKLSRALAGRIRASAACRAGQSETAICDDLAVHYGVSRTTIRQVLRNERWRVARQEDPRIAEINRQQVALIRQCLERERAGC